MPIGNHSKSHIIRTSFSWLASFGLDGFILALAGAIILAYIWPEPGTREGTFSLSKLANYGISGIFFFYGLKLSWQKLRAGLLNWKLHLLVQSSTFVLFPLMILPWKGLFTTEQLQTLWLGAFFLASLPSTVSSSVVMVSIAGGNLPAAIFNASISSIIGVLVTPIWMSVVFTSETGGGDFSDIFGKLILQVLVPVAIGMVLNPRLGHWAERHRKGLKYFDQTIILIIVYTAFSESFAQKMFSRLGVTEIFMLGIGMLVLFFLVYGLISLGCKALNFNREDQITAVFCGSKKSLVHGTVMSSVLFASSTMTGVLLLPLMIYHALQLFIVGLLAKRMANRLLDLKTYTEDRP